LILDAMVDPVVYHKCTALVYRIYKDTPVIQGFQ
jgi:hypothetical protein